MKHIETIKAFIKTLMNSESFHALVVQSPPGWGKSTTINLALKDLEVDAVTVGAYATPLHIYNTMCSNPSGVIVLDDCAGLFSDAKTMSVLKSATWHNSNTQISTHPSENIRRISWGSTSEKVENPSVDFRGKIILLTNMISTGKETESFLSRCLSYRIAFTGDDIKQMLFTAADSREYFSQSELAHEVAGFLIQESNQSNLEKVNLRTLKMGYDLALTHPEIWRDLFVHLLPKNNEKSPDSLSQIFQSAISAKEQERTFVQATGKSRRTYYNYKKKMGLTRLYSSR